MKASVKFEVMSLSESRDANKEKQIMEISRGGVAEADNYPRPVVEYNRTISCRLLYRNMGSEFWPR